MSRLPKVSLLLQCFPRALALGWQLLLHFLFCSTPCADAFPLCFLSVFVLSGDTQRSSLPDLKNSGEIEGTFLFDSCKLGSLVSPTLVVV